LHSQSSTHRKFPVTHQTCRSELAREKLECTTGHLVYTLLFSIGTSPIIKLGPDRVLLMNLFEAHQLHYMDTVGQAFSSPSIKRFNLFWRSGRSNRTRLQANQASSSGFVPLRCEYWVCPFSPLAHRSAFRRFSMTYLISLLSCLDLSELCMLSRQWIVVSEVFALLAGLIGAQRSWTSKRAVCQEVDCVTFKTPLTHHTSILTGG
jgi:hypothetical protein